jgi:hypothetical protein
MTHFFGHLRVITVPIIVILGSIPKASVQLVVWSFFSFIIWWQMGCSSIYSVLSNIPVPYNAVMIHWTRSNFASIYGREYMSHSCDKVSD